MPDTKTEWIRAQAYRVMTPVRRFQIAQELVRTGRTMVENAIRAQHSTFSPHQIEIELWNRGL